MNGENTEILFLGTGAADWTCPGDDGEFRGFSSVLIDGHILIDCTFSAIGKMKELGLKSVCVTDLLITHSHRDHLDMEAVGAIADERKGAGLGPLRLYGESSRAPALKRDGVEVIPLRMGEEAAVWDYRVHPLEANHTGNDPRERPLHYLFQREESCWLYATDGAWMLTPAWRFLRDFVLDGLIVDCTIGEGHDGDYRIFEHNSIAMVRLMTETLRRQGVLSPKAWVVLTHMARTLTPPRDRLDQSLHFPFKAAYDGYLHRI